jgi:hypothetical protein
MKRAKDLTGQKFGKLTVIKRGENYKMHVQWECKCDCNNPELILVRTQHLENGIKTSCGCVRKENVIQARINKYNHSGCMVCGSEEHYAKGMCRSCYRKSIREKNK